MKLLVTGGAGYIGSVVAHRLVEAGHELLVMKNHFKEYERAAPEAARFTGGCPARRAGAPRRPY